jgi:hypothetical protein
MEVQATLSVLIAAIWVWSITSAKLVRLVATQSPERLLVLPLWAMQGGGYAALSIINLGLLVGQFGLPIAAFVSFPLKIAAAILGGALLLSMVLAFALSAIIRPAMLRYFAAAALSIAAGIAYCVARYT